MNVPKIGLVWSSFLRLLRERVVSLPEEVILAMSRLLQRVNQHSKKIK